MMPFIPISKSKVGFYICGPTVYDTSHMGHARNYLSFDIIRRVMEDYFGFNIFYVMNITDIDDKIIIRTWQNRIRAITDQFARDSPAFSEWLAAELPKHKTPENLSALRDQLLSGVDVPEEVRAAWLASAAGCSTEPWQVQEAFLELAQKFEVEYFEDMKALGMRMPTAVTRVSEYVPEIIKFIEVIIGKGMAYAAEGNVYFDHTAFVDAGNAYAKTALNASAELLDEGEGAAMATDGKRTQRDFALWKKAKPGEPRWDSPWGEGRPGWHIECSAMASDLLGSHLDLNGGGTDLRFPHHDNQLAQSEAHFGCKQWVNYFLHTGHLHINGLKMSKSLKNFISIRNCLRRYTARQLRLFFLTVHWHSEMEIQMVAKETDPKGVSVQSASIRSGQQSIDATEFVRGFVTDDTIELFIPAGTLIPSASNDGAVSSSAASPSTSTLFIQYVVDGQTEESTWALLADGRLADSVQVVAGGIVQLESVVGLERKFAEFFLNSQSYLRKLGGSRLPNLKWSAADRELHAELQQTQTLVHEALCQSIDTPTVVTLLQKLVDRTVALLPPNGGAPCSTLISSVAVFVQRIFRIFGLYAEEGLDDGELVGFPWPNGLQSKVRQPIATVLDALGKFREQVRDLARAKAPADQFEQLCSSTSLPALASSVSDSLLAEMQTFIELVRANATNTSAILRECDRLRDATLPRHGVRFEDLPDKTYQWKLDDPRALATAAAQSQKTGKKATNANSNKGKAAGAIERNSIPPEQFFRTHPDHKDKYSQFDEQGVPTHAANGDKLSKSALSKVTKLFQDQTKRYASWSSKNQK